MESMESMFAAVVFTGALFLGVLAALDAGRRLGLRAIAAQPGAGPAGTGAIEGAVFGLLGLLIAFTFSGAASRFDVRRDLIVQETNAIGTAYLRIDTLPQDRQAAMRGRFRDYLNTRIEVYRHRTDFQAARAALDRSAVLQNALWTGAIDAVQAPGAMAAAPMLFLPALNEMFDITTTRLMATRTHPPMVIFVLLFVMALASSAFAGYGMAVSPSRRWFHAIGFALVVAVAVYVILDLEFPRLGLIRVDSFDQALIDLRAGMR